MNKQQLILKQNKIQIIREAKPNNYFDKVGRKSAILGYENGTFEFWCYPMKICRNFSISFLLNSTTVPIEPSSIVKNIHVTPECTIITFCYQSFTVKEIFITPFDEPGGIILFDVETIEPIKFIVSFLPEMQPMWPAGIGGQYCIWDKESNAYILSESRKKFNAFIGSPDAKSLSYTPAHMFSDSPYQFIIEVTPENSKDNIFVIGLAGGMMEKTEAKRIYDNLINDPIKYYNDYYRYYQDLSKDTMQINTPDRRINLAFEWGKVSFDNMIVDNPQLGKGLISGLGCSGKSGRPGFGWFFAGDACLNSFAMLGYGAFEIIKDSLLFIQQFQREDGKIAHEVSQSTKLVDWFEYPYAYIHADTTCFYLISMYEYLIASGDIDFINKSWGSILKAYSWCISTDENMDGLMDNSKAGLGAFEIPPFTRVNTDIYLSSAFVMALFGLKEMAKAIDEPEIDFLNRYEKALNELNEKFWDRENEFFAFAIDNENKLIKETTALCAVPMIWRLLDEERALKALEKINSAELQTDWGTRSMSNKSKYYDPLNYNYGAVWPFMTTFSILANYRYQNHLQAFPILKSIVEHTFDNAIGYCHEVFSGHMNRHLEESVPHQAFSTLGYMLPLIKGTFGLSGDAIKREITFSPQFPSSWGSAEVINYKIGKNSFNFYYDRQVLESDIPTEKEEIWIDFNVNGPEKYKIKFELSFSSFSDIVDVWLGNQKLKHKVKKNNRNLVLYFELSDVTNGSIIIEYLPTYEIVPCEYNFKVGASTQSLKILKEINYADCKTIMVEGLNGRSYILDVINSEFILKVEGAKLINNGLLIEFPVSDEKGYIRKEIKIFS